MENTFKGKLFDIQGISANELKREFLKENGYIGEHPYNFYSIILMFEKGSSEQTIMNAISRHFAVHSNHLMNQFGSCEYIGHKELLIEEVDPLVKYEEGYIYIKVDYRITLDVFNSKNLLEEWGKRESDFDKTLDE